MPPQVLRNTELMSFKDVEKAIGLYGKKAKEGSLALEDMAGGTFTISNGGVFGSLLGTPIINPPQSAILGMHATKLRPVVKDGQVGLSLLSSSPYRKLSTTRNGS
jgi:2-oxoglutarate dehydrogenase E2 component (dihydrolipoamide succinyltransferase)